MILLVFEEETSNVWTKKVNVVRDSDNQCSDTSSSSMSPDYPWMPHPGCSFQIELEHIMNFLTRGQYKEVSTWKVSSTWENGMKGCQVLSACLWSDVWWAKTWLQCTCATHPEIPTTASILSPAFSLCSALWSLALVEPAEPAPATTVHISSYLFALLAPTHCVSIKTT